MSVTDKMKQSLAYKLLERIKEDRNKKFDYIDLDDLESIIKDEEPEISQLFENETYDGPPDGEAWSGGDC